MERNKHNTGSHKKSFLFGAAARRWVSIHLKCPATILINRLLVDKHWQFWQDDLNLCYLKNNNWDKESVPVDLIIAGFCLMRCSMRVIKKNKTTTTKKTAQVVDCSVPFFTHTNTQLPSSVVGSEGLTEFFLSSFQFICLSAGWQQICKLRFNYT